MVQESAVASTDKVDKVGKIEKWIFYFLCGYALSSSVSIGGANIFLGLATVTAIVRLVKKHDDWRELLKVDKGLCAPFFIFIGVLILTNFFSLDIEASARNMVQFYINNFEPFLLAIMFVRKKDCLLKLAGILVVSSIINDVYCIFQWINGSFRPDGFLRIMSTAGMLSIGVPVLALFFVCANRKIKYYLGLALAISSLTAIFNNTRGAWVAIMVTVVVICVLYAKSKIKALALLGAVLIGLSLVSYNVEWIHVRMVSITNITDDRSNKERLYLWTSSRNMAADYPLTGVGSGNFGRQYHEKYMLPEAKEPDLIHAHNLFFHELAEHGYPGGIAFIIWVLGTLVYCVRGWHKEKNIGYLFLMTIFLGLMLNGLTERSFGHPIVMKLFWFGIGLSYQWIRLNRENIE